MTKLVPAMDYAACHIVYVDKRAYKERYEKRGGPVTPGAPTYMPGSIEGFDLENKEVQHNLCEILSVFNGVHVCNSGISCMAKIREFDKSIETDLVPTVVILETVMDPDVDSRPLQRPSTGRSTPSPTSPGAFTPSSEPEELYGLSLLQHIANELSNTSLSKLIVPIAMTHNWEGVLAQQPRTGSSRASRSASKGNSHSQFREPIDLKPREAFDPSKSVDPNLIMRCINAGAIDVITSPLRKDRICALTAPVYRAHKDASKDQAAFLATKRVRKRSWVGVDEEQPYGYLRETMVSKLMRSICEPESVLHAPEPRNSYILERRQETNVAKAIAQWNFSAHAFSDDELVHAAFLMLQHALDMPELENYRLPADDLKNFLIACRAAYNGFVLYHNFRHVVDVLQAVFYFLLQLGILPPYPVYSKAVRRGQTVTPVAALLKPVDALTLLVSAIGHDVGHPGVNNAFLVALKAPLAQVYNDNSVLEAFHCAAYSQILRHYWNRVFEEIGIRRLLITSILATDMGVHFKYMTDLGNLQEKLHHNQGTDGWNDKILDEYRTLACGLLIKCADISNVARPFEVAARWSHILQLEFAKQGEMEKDVGIPTTLFGGPPELGNITKLATSQIGFMNIFAGPLFEAVADILPGMWFAVEEIRANHTVWKRKIEAERNSQQCISEAENYVTEGFQSPRSGSPDRFVSRPADLSHPEGLPANGSSPALPTEVPMSTSSPLPNLDSRRSSLGSLSALRADTSSTSRSRDPSRRSSLGHTFPCSSPVQDPISLSRRSSGASAAANVPSQLSAIRRSSNTVPSQLQLNIIGFAAALSPSERSAAFDNVPPRPASVDTLSQSAQCRTSSVDPVAIPGRYGSTASNRDDTVDDAGTSSSHPSAPFHQYFPRPVTHHHSVFSSPNRYSTLSSCQDRYSNTTSGAFTTSSHALPSSPTDTQATSFFTDGSDVGTGDDATSLAPELPQYDALNATPGFNLGTDGVDERDFDEVKPHVTLTNGHSVIGERVISRKGSRFRLDFWRRRAKDGSS